MAHLFKSGSTADSITSNLAFYSSLQLASLPPDSPFCRPHDIFPDSISSYHFTTQNLLHLAIQVHHPGFSMESAMCWETPPSQANWKGCVPSLIIDFSLGLA